MLFIYFTKNSLHRDCKSFYISKELYIKVRVSKNCSVMSKTKVKSLKRQNLEISADINVLRSAGRINTNTNATTTTRGGEHSTSGTSGGGGEADSQVNCGSQRHLQRSGPHGR